jgi:hypothetical protein
MKKIALFFIVFLFITKNGFADVNDNQQFDPNSLFGQYGISYNIKGEQVDINIDQEKVINSIPDLKKIGIINPDITQTDINLNKIEIAGSTALNATTAIVMSIYQTTKLDNLQFKGYLLSPDNYGNNQKHLIFSFGFDKKTADKVNWENISLEGFAKISKNFHFSNWYAANVEEQDEGD